MHAPVWHTPQPLWKPALDDPAPHARFRRPELLRFASDAFMDEVQAQLAADPATIETLVARGETWRDERVGWSPVAESDEVIKLYQPVHQRYYLVAASLVCQVRGLPDRTVDVSDQEATAFVLRRLPTDADGVPLDETTPGYTEYGWFGDSGWKSIDGPGGLDRIDGAAGGDGAPVLEREERLPLFPLAFTDATFGQTRRLLAGFVPVAGRETYESAPRTDAPAPTPDPDDPLGNPRLGQYDAHVAWGLRTVYEGLTGSPPNPPADLTAEDVREPFAFALLDLVVFLQRYLPDVWQAIEDGGDDTGLSDLERDVLETIEVLNDDYDVTWAVLRALDTHRVLLESGQVDFSGATLPGHGLNRLVQISKDDIEDAIADLGVTDETYLDPAAACVATSLNCRIREALEVSDEPFESDEPVANPEVASRTGSDVGSVYAIRCVYERPRCRRFGRLPLVSARSRPFRLAGFFDPDAPVRPTRIALPVDTSISGLRSFPKAVSFLVSDQLRAQMDRVQGIKLQALDDGEIGEEGGWTLGMICSLSIPIITICAFILLLIIVFALNIVFWWIPFFRICFPIPVKK